MSDSVTVLVNGTAVTVAAGSMVSAALTVAGISAFRKSVSGNPRGPLCGMGVCFECRVTINGRSQCRSCQTPCQPGMNVNTDDSEACL